MAIQILLTPLILINAVDLTDHGSKVTIETTKDAVDITAFGAAFKAFALGLGDASITVTFFQDFQAAKVDQTLWPLAGAAAFPIEIRPNNAARSATNPAYLLTALLQTYNPLAGSVGDASETDVKFINGSQSGLTRLIV